MTRIARSASRSSIAPLLVTLALLLAACGGGADPDVAADDPATETEGDEPTSAPETDDPEPTAEPTAEAPSFEGKQIRLTSTYSPSGSGDQVARLHAEFLAEYIPGNPTIVVEGREGGAHSIGNNWFYANAAPDGTDLLFSASTALDQWMRGGDHIEFELPEYEFIGSLRSGTGLVIVRPEVVDRLTDPDADPVVVGDTDGLRSVAVTTMFAARHLGYNFRWAIGYEGGADVELAFLNGEVDVHGGSGVGALQELIDTAGAVPIYQLGSERSPDYPDVPTIWELLAGAESFTAEEEAAFRLGMTRELFDSFTSAPPGADPAALEIVRKAYAEMAQDPEFLAPVSELYGGDVQYLSSEEIRAIVLDAVDVPEDTAALLASIREEYGLPSGED